VGRLHRLDRHPGLGADRQDLLTLARRADLLRRAGRPAEAHAAYRRALDLAQTEPEQRFLEERLAETRN